MRDKTGVEISEAEKGDSKKRLQSVFHPTQGGEKTFVATRNVNPSTAIF